MSESRTFWGTERTRRDEHEDEHLTVDGQPVTDAEQPATDERLTTEDLAGARAEEPANGQPVEDGSGGSATDGSSADQGSPDSTPVDGTLDDSTPDDSAPADGIDLLDDETIAARRSRWQDVQADFVDEPRRAVQDADSLVAELMQRLAKAFAAERQQLESRWSRGDEVSTEDLRLTLRHYRSFFQRLLAF